jgi:hypothetical protein
MSSSPGRSAWECKNRDAFVIERKMLLTLKSLAEQN